MYSVQNALKVLGHDSFLSDTKSEIDSADILIFPGVGSFAHVKNELNEKGLTPIIKDFAKRGKPFLGICLGMQLLFELSHEGDAPCEGLSLLSGEVLPLPPEKISRIPHIGWNSLSFKEDQVFAGIKSGSQVYFVHSYFCAASEENTLATTDVVPGFSVPVIVRKNNIYGMQFHPERSGNIGLKLLKNFIEGK